MWFGLVFSVAKIAFHTHIRNRVSITNHSNPLERAEIVSICFRFEKS
jgi:hypothetical protein